MTDTTRLSKEAAPSSPVRASGRGWPSASVNSGADSQRAKILLVREIEAGSTDAFYVAKLQTARFYFARLFPETATLMRTARAGSRSLMDTDQALA